MVYLALILGTISLFVAGTALLVSAIHYPETFNYPVKLTITAAMTLILAAYLLGGLTFQQLAEIIFWSLALN